MASPIVDILRARLGTLRPDERASALSEDDLRALAELPELTRAGAVKALAGELGLPLQPLKGAVKGAGARAETERRTRAEQEAPRVRSWEDELQRTRDGETASSFPNLCTILAHEWEDRFVYNRMEETPYLDGEAIKPVTIARIRRDVSQRHGCNWTKDDVQEAVRLVSVEQGEFHPVADYLHGLRWKGVKLLDNVARDLLGLEDRLSAIMVRRWFISLVARALVHEWSPIEGAEVKTVLILLGPQDGKKSKWFKEWGKPWYGNDDPDLRDRRGYMTLRRLWIWENQEIDGWLTKGTNEATKGQISRACDVFPDLFSSLPQSWVRGWVMCGTSNKTRILTDASGDSRYWPLNLFPNGPDWTVDEYKIRACRDQVYAEAVVYFERFLEIQRSGTKDDENPYRWWLNKGESKERTKVSASMYRVEDAWAETVSRWLAGLAITCPVCRGVKRSEQFPCANCSGQGTVTRGALPKTADGLEYVTTTLVLEGAIGMAARDIPRGHGQCATTLASLGWQSGPRIEAAKGVWVTPYYRVSEGRTVDDELGDAAEAAAVREASKGET